MLNAKCSCEFIVTKFSRKDVPEHYNTCAIKLEERKNEFKLQLPRDIEGRLQHINPYLLKLQRDCLYHLALDTETHNLRQLFGDVKFVCMGGTPSRMEHLAKLAVKELGIEFSSGCGLVDMTVASQRYCLYKVGPVISINHGIGVTTLSVVLQEVIKLLQYARARDPIIVRVGTSGGIDIEPGTVVVSGQAFDGMLNNTYDLPVLGRVVSTPAILDLRLANEIAAMAEDDDDFKTIIGGTMCANDFYNGQGRLDGPFCDYTEGDKMAFLNKLKDRGIKNIEMEVTCLAALTHKAGIKAAVLCVTYLNRLHGDQVTTPKSVLLEWQERPMKILFRFIKAYLKTINKLPYGRC